MNIKVENFKLLIRNLRKKKNSKLRIRSTANDMKYPKLTRAIEIRGNDESKIQRVVDIVEYNSVSKSVQISKQIESDHS